MDPLQLLDLFLSSIPTFRAMMKDRRKELDNALRALNVAIGETYLYYRDFERGQERDLTRESIIAKYWGVAAISVRSIDPALAEICEYKSEYWLNPDRYKNNVRKMGESLKKAQDAYKALLLPKRK